LNDINTNDSDSNKWAGSVHVAAILLALFTSWSAGVGGMVAGLVVWLIKKDDSAFVRKHAADAFNFHLAMFLIMAATWIFVIFTLGIGILVIWPVWLILAVIWLWCSVRAAIAGFDGKDSSYPFSLKLLS
jgi:uncharacterized Tic20 family protein